MLPITGAKLCVNISQYVCKVDLIFTKHKRGKCIKNSVCWYVYRPKKVEVLSLDAIKEQEKKTKN